MSIDVRPSEPIPPDPRDPPVPQDGVRDDTEGETTDATQTRMSDAEAVMWAVEKDPALRSDYCNLTILEHAPDPDRFAAKLEDALIAIPRLAQRVVSAPLRIAPPEWVADPALDLDYHVKRVSLPEPGDERALLDVCASLAETPFDRGRALWEFTLIEGLSDGRVAMLQKLHHTIADGVGALKLSLALVDFEPDPPVETERRKRKSGIDRGESATSPLTVARDAIRDAAFKQAALARQSLEGVAGLVTNPKRVPGAVSDGVRLAGSLRRQLLVTEPAHSDVMIERSLRRHFEIVTTSLPAVRAAANALGGSINDVFVTAIAGALGDYHAARGSEVSDLRMAMPVSTRQRGDSGANRFAPMRVIIPIRPLDPRARFAHTHEALASAKSERALGSLDLVAGFTAGLPTSLLVALARAQTRTIDFAASNLRGSPVPLYLAGAPIMGNFGLGPRTGCAVNVTMMTYCDECHLGLNVDPAAIVEPAEFIEAVRVAFDELASMAHARD